MYRLLEAIDAAERGRTSDTPERLRAMEIYLAAHFRADLTDNRIWTTVLTETELGRLKPIAARVAERLRAVGLAGSEGKLISELSGGMRKRAGIARATVADPELVIYDEPTAGLDPVTTQKIYDLLVADHARTGATVLAVSSDAMALAQFVDEIAFLYRGQVLYRGPAHTIADAPDPIVRQFVRGELDGPLDDRSAL